VAPKPKPKLTKDQMEKRIVSTLDEYIEIKDLNEVTLTLTEMGSKECFPHVAFKAYEMACDKPQVAEPLVKLLGDLVDAKTLSKDDVARGSEEYLEFLEDIVLDLPAAPRICAAFIMGGIRGGFYSWQFLQSLSDKYWKETGYSEKFLGHALQQAQEKWGLKDAREQWAASKLSLFDFGVKDECKFIEMNSLDKLMPLPQVRKKVAAMVEAGASDEEMSAWIDQTLGREDVDRDVWRCIAGLIVRHACQEAGGKEVLGAVDPGTELRMDPSFAKLKEQLSKRQVFLKRYLEAECDQAYALFEVQVVAHELGNPPSLLANLFAALYDLEIVEETACADWKNPPENRHLFLNAAREAFAPRDNIEAQKQVHCPPRTQEHSCVCSWWKPAVAIRTFARLTVARPVARPLTTLSALRSVRSSLRGSKKSR